jgi:hypothetical protein
MQAKDQMYMRQIVANIQKLIKKQERQKESQQPISSHLHLGLPSDLFPSGFPTKILYAFLFPHACYMPCLSHPP